MATSKEYMQFVLERCPEGTTVRAMMGEYILYFNGKVLGGIYDDRLLVKPTKSAMALIPDAQWELPYEGAKEMLLVDRIEEKDFLTELLNTMYEELPAPKRRKGYDPENRQKGTVPMKILIVNDDSISAPGIALLAKTAAEFGEVTVVAPAQQCSAMSQKLTLRESMVVEKAESFPVKVQGAYQVDGTPVDCVKVALDYILQETPDYVFSGINNGYNVGYDIAYSGTLGAAFEAVRNGIPAMAFSIAGDNHLPYVQPYLEKVLRELLEAEPEQGTVWNVNFPAMRSGAPKGLLRDRPVAAVSLFREQYIETKLPDGRITLTCQGIPTPNDQIPVGTDAEAVRQGYIAISKVRGVL